MLTENIKLFSVKKLNKSKRMWKTMAVKVRSVKLIFVCMRNLSFGLCSRSDICLAASSWRLHDSGVLSAKSL